MKGGFTREEKEVKSLLKKTLGWYREVQRLDIGVLAVSSFVSVFPAPIVRSMMSVSLSERYIIVFDEKYQKGAERFKALYEKNFGRSLELRTLYDLTLDTLP